MSAPRPFVTNPFHPLGSTRNNKSFLHTYQNVRNIMRKYAKNDFFNHVRVVLGKTPLKETPNIRELRPF